MWRQRAVALGVMPEQMLEHARTLGREQVITTHLSVESVEQLLAKRDILDPAFKQHLDSLASTEAKAAAIEHAIRHEIHVHRDENPTAYASLWEQLERIVNERREARVSAASALARLEEMEAQVSGDDFTSFHGTMSSAKAGVAVRPIAIAMDVASLSIAPHPMCRECGLDNYALTGVVNSPLQIFKRLRSSSQYGFRR